MHSGADEVLDARIVADVEVRSRSRPDRYRVETMQGSCTRRTAERGSWAIRVTSAMAQQRRLELSIPDAAAAERGTEIFALALRVGTDGDSVVHEIDGTGTRASSVGSGRATVLDNGFSATVVVEGLTQHGTRLGAVIRCSHVTRTPGPHGG